MSGKTRPTAGQTNKAAPEEPQLKRLKRALGRRYAVERAIGQGGMATVYLAEDLRHHRKVAVKVLRSGLTSALGPDRFLQEVGFAAQLQHPHILPLYDSGKAGGFLFYVMPFVDGESLRDKLYRDRRLPVQQTVHIIRDVIDALVCAHGRKVIHRDIKPDNVMLSGRHALVMDFGVAKAVSQAGHKKALTTHGITVGTPRYMAPEQAAGDPNIDHRADIYAVGVMAYELLAGRPPIEGETPQATLAAQVTEIPRPLNEVVPDVPAGVSNTIMRCLEKRPEERWQSAVELLQQFDAIGIPRGELTPTGAVLATARRITRSRVGAGVVGALILATAIVAVPLLRGDGVPTPVAAPHSQLTFSGNVATAEISPNGEFLAYVTDSQILVEDLRGGTTLELATREPAATSKVTTLRWSPDGSEVLVVKRDSSGRGTGLAYPRLGGPPRPLRVGGYAAWSPDGAQVAWWYQHSPIYLLTVATGEVDSISLPTSDSAGYRSQGDWSPDGRLIAIGVMAHEAPVRFQIWTVAVDGSGIHRVVDEAQAIRSPRWSSGSNALYYLQEADKDAELRKVETGPDGRIRGNPRVLRRGIVTTGQISLTGDGGRLALTRVHEWSDVWFATGDRRSTTVQFATQKLTAGTTPKMRARVSPNGALLAYTQDGERGSEIVVVSIHDDSSPRRIDVGGQFQSAGVAWSPDGQRIAALTLVRDAARIRIFDLEGASRTLGHTEVGTELRWAPGDRILYQRTGARNFHLLDSTQSEERPLVSNDSLGWMSSPESAPDGERVAVQWNRGGQVAVWVVSLRDSSQTLLLTGSRYRPVGWSADGESVYVLNNETQAIFLIPADGGMAAEVAVVPFEEADCTLQERGDVLSLACAVPMATSDTWVIENFDPQLTNER